MKRFIYSLMLLAMGYGATAQIDFGPRVNLTSTNLSLEDNVNNVQEGDAEFGYQLGLFARIKLPVLGLYVQPEALFSNSAATVNVNTEEIDLDFSQIDVPVLVGIHLGPVRVNVGPSFRFLMNAEATDPMGVKEDIQDNYKDSTVGFQAGAGIDIWKFVFDLKYEGSLDDIAEEANLVGDQRINQWVFGVGFKLF